MKTIILTLSAAKDLDALPRDAREQVEGGLHRYAMTGQGDVKALQGRGGYRLRIGSYRVIFDEDVPGPRSWALKVEGPLGPLLKTIASQPFRSTSSGSTA